MAADRIAGLNKILRNAAVGDFSYSDERLMLGDLCGNHFKIAIRDLPTESLKNIENSLNSLKTLGFINYYGMQRFGTRSLPTSAPGKTMLAEKWQETAEMILGDRVDDHGVVKDARLHWKEHKDAKAALEMFPKNCIAERAILKSLSQKSDTPNYIEAIRTVDLF